MSLYGFIYLFISTTTQQPGASLRTLGMQFPVFLLSKVTLLYMIKENKVPFFLCHCERW